MGSRNCPAVSSCTMSMSRPAATFPIRKKIRNSLTSCASSTKLTAWFKDRRRAGKPTILVGDLNIAPLETDVWSHKQLLDVVSHTPVEVDKLGWLQEAAKFVDAVRHFIPPEQKLYTWWSYRARDWAASDRGRRLDHVWVTPVLKDQLAGAAVHRAARDWERGSDHVPVLVRLYD